MSEVTPRPTSFDQQITDRLGEVGQGWRPVLRRLHEQLFAMARDYRLDELTPMLGGLRIYIADRADRFDCNGDFDGAWVDTAGQLAETAATGEESTCESCGAPGRTRFHGDQHGTWIRTLCDHCKDAATLILPAGQGPALPLSPSDFEVGAPGSEPGLPL